MRQIKEQSESMTRDTVNLEVVISIPEVQKFWFDFVI
jgi:hypothetical protein